MKKTITRILGVAVTLAMLTGLMVSATPVSGADPLKWGEPNTVSSYAECVIGQLIPGTDVKDYAVAPNTTTMYATLGTFAYPTPAHCFDPYDQKWYIAKTTSGGMMWSWVEIKDDEGDPLVTTSIDLVAIASDSDDGSIVAAVIDGNKVVASLDGGSSWTDLEVPEEASSGETAEVLYCIDINREVSGKRYVAVGGNTTDGDAGLWYFDLGGGLGAKWIDAAEATTWNDGKLIASDAVLACQFSPNFPSDRTIAVITGPNVADADATDEPVLVQLANFNAQTWNDDQYGSNWVGGVSVFQTSTGTTVNLDDDEVVNAASLSLPTTYIASDEAARIIFVGVATSDSASVGGIYRLDDEEVLELEEDEICSVAYNTDSDLLVAGAYDDNQVHRCDNPLAKEPDVYQATTLKRPGSNDDTNMLQVFWAGSKVVSGSQGLDSCFSVSTDNGKSFNDISLIDHDVGAEHDFDIDAAGTKIYAVTEDGSDIMLWAGMGYSWQRVLLVDNAAAAGDYLVRMAPDDSNIVYLAQIGSTTIYYSDDGGATKWMRRYCGVTLVDLAVESAEVVYAVDSAGFISKSEDGGFVWSSPKKDTGLGEGATIVSVGEGKLMVGGSSGGVAYSIDSGETWKKMSDVGSGKVQLCADGLDSGSHIYAATSKTSDYVYRATLPSTSWTKITDDPLPYSCYGIGLSEDDVLYVLTRETGYSFTDLTFGGTTRTYTSANFSESEFEPGSVTVLTTKSDYATVNDIISDNDDPDDDDMSSLCGGTGTIDYDDQELDLTFDEAVYYVSITYNSNSRVYRCLTPTEETDDILEAWSIIGGPGKEFDSGGEGLGPRALRITGNTLWAITKPQSSSGKIYQLTDSIQVPEAGPPITSPADGSTLQVNKETGRAFDQIFRWDRPEKTVTEYELEIAYDSDFRAKVATITVVSESATVVVALGPYSSAWEDKDTDGLVDAGEMINLEYMPGTTYYWRVRVTEPFYSPWTVTRSFQAQALEVAAPEPEPVLEPVVSTPSFAAENVSIRPTFSWTAIAGATYEFVLAEDLGLDDPFEIIDYSATCDINAHVAREDLKYSTTYHWRVRSISDAGTSAWVRGLFTTMAEPEEAEPPVEIIQQPAAEAPEIILEVPPTPAPVQVIPDYLLWVIVAVGAVLIIAVIVLIVRTRRVT